MQRLLMDDLIHWKDMPDRKPLVLQGIRHCGKTHLLRDFGKRFFTDVLYIDFSEDKGVADLFGQHYESARILTNLSIYYERDIISEQTLIILDEIQLCPAAVESLAGFAAGCARYFITAAASYPYVALPHGCSFPVGNVEILTLYPMNFFEFFHAQSPMLALHLKVSGFNADPYKTFHKQLEEKFRDYQIVGGMPDAVKSWIETKSIESVNSILDTLLMNIEGDLAKYCPAKSLPKLLSIWHSIPAQLVKGNRKFMFSKIKKSWRGKDLDDAIYWLTRTGLVHRVLHIDSPGIPLSGYINQSHFKLYMCDPGLLRRAGQFHSSVFLGSDSAFADIRSTVVENIVCCELTRIYEQNLYYWSTEHPGKAEVEFIVQDNEELIPIEVKAWSAGRARSLQQYRMKYNPKKYVLTGTDIDKDDILPLYAFWNLKEWLAAKS